MSLRRIQIPPEVAAEGKYLFEETTTLRQDIAAMMGIKPDTLRRRSIEWGWKEGPRKSAVRADGRVIHDTYLFEVKAPAESKGPWDYYKLISTTPADKAFRPMNEGSCPLVAGISNMAK